MDAIPYLFIDLSKVDWTQTRWPMREPRKPLTPQPPKVYPVVHKHWPIEAWLNCPDCKEKQHALRSR